MYNFADYYQLLKLCLFRPIIIENLCSLKHLKQIKPQADRELEVDGHETKPTFP